MRLFFSVLISLTSPLLFADSPDKTTATLKDGTQIILSTTDMSAEVFFQKKGESTPKSLGKIEDRETTVNLTPAGVVEFSLEEGGSLSVTTTTKWRLQKEKLVLIGEESVAYNRPACNHKSKADPCKHTTSVNYLTGNIEMQSEFFDGKTMKKKCTFSSSKYEDYEFVKNLGRGPGLACPLKT